MITIIRSIGVTTLVALMSAHRAAGRQWAAETWPLEQAAVDAMEACLRSNETPPVQEPNAPPPSYNSLPNRVPCATGRSADRGLAR
jgi:hypothetical protein